jgi:hypothetical protein
MKNCKLAGLMCFPPLSIPRLLPIIEGRSSYATAEERIGTVDTNGNVEVMKTKGYKSLERRGSTAGLVESRRNRFMRIKARVAAGRWKVHIC